MRHHHIVELDEGLGIELAPRLRKGRLGHLPHGHLAARQFGQERIQLVLQGVLEEIHQNQYGAHQAELALAGEIPWRIAVPGRKMWII